MSRWKGGRQPVAPVRAGNRGVVLDLDGEGEAVGFSDMTGPAHADEVPPSARRGLVEVNRRQAKTP